MLSLKSVRDEDLLRQLALLVKQSRGVEAEIVAHIDEMEQRRLYAREACSSMFEYCRRALCLRENEAYLRITVARAAREHPVLLEMLRDGRLHLSGIARLAPHLTRENVHAVLKRACGRSHREIRELVAELEPRPDVAPIVRKLPERHAAGGASSLQLGAPRVESDAVNLAVTLEPRLPVLARPALVEPLAPARYQVRFTASIELRDKLERLQALMRSAVPDGDLARIIEIAVSEKLRRVEAKRFGQTKTPRGDRSAMDKGPSDASLSDTTPSSRHIPAAVRRLVHERDGGRCAYRDAYGRRCGKRHDLEFHHKHPFAHGGDHSPANVTLLCRAHNTLMAEQDYGADVMARFRAAASRACVPVDAYGARIAVRPRRLLTG
jgi:5-methylcytosine-specific restriction endonuclease McrA